MDPGGGHGTSASDGAAIGRVDPALFAKPLDYIDAEYSRLLAVLRLLDNIGPASGSGAWRRLARVVVDYLSGDFVHHLADGSDLFEFLMDDRRVDASVASLIGCLRHNHIDARASAGRLRSALEERLRFDAPAAQAEAVVAAENFIVAQRARLKVEVDRLMPVARARLGPTQRRRLARRMAARRTAG